MEARFNAALFDSSDPEERARSERAVVRLMRAAFWGNVDWLQLHPETPFIYDLFRDGRLYYLEDPPGIEEWACIPEVMERGAGDCKKLATWLAAELFVRANRERPDLIQQGFRAWPALLGAVEVIRRDGRLLRVYHVVTKVYIPGRGVLTLDPSADMGMQSRKPSWA